jgi:hypothetical protein
MTYWIDYRGLKIFLFLPLLAVFIFYWSCEKEKQVMVPKSEHETFTLIIVAADALSNPDSVTQGSTIKLTVDVSNLPRKNNLTFDWSATGGKFDQEEGDTVSWKAPDDPGAYTVTAHADDGGTNVYKGTRTIGVGMYAPTLSPYYVGASGCLPCHSHASIYSEWEETAHAHAWKTLQESGHPAPYCVRCHSVDTQEEPGNSGYDDAPITLYENVQCENCHGPASEHIYNMSADLIQVDFSAENCGQCHEGTHHPYLSEWKNSPHAFDAEESEGATNGSCQGCHEGVASAARLSSESALAGFFGGEPYGTAARDTFNSPLQPIVCSTCHDPHTADNPAQLRTVADIYLVTANGESPVITEGGSGKLCMQCHHARRGPESQIENGYEYFGPHANPQADMMAGKSAYQGVADVSYEWADPSHLHVQNSCKTCHLNMAEYTSEESPAVTGHTFLPRVEACQNCHGTIYAFDDIKALEDFDGNGTIEGIQSEVSGLLNILVTELVNSGLDTTGGLTHALGDTTISTRAQRESGYNWAFITDDKSLGIHNPDYTIQLLQQSIQHLTGNPLPKEAILNKDRKAVANF